MAEGDLTKFHQFDVDLGNKIHDLDSDTWKVGIIDSTLTPLAANAAPHWGGTGTSDLSTNEVTPGGNYSAGGVTLASLDYIDSGGVTPWRAGKISIAVHASNPTTARWMVLYNSTDANKRCALFIDLGAVKDLTTGAFEFRFNSTDGTGIILNVT